MLTGPRPPIQSLGAKVLMHLKLSLSFTFSSLPPPRISLSAPFSVFPAVCISVSPAVCLSVSLFLDLSLLLYLLSPISVYHLLSFLSRTLALSLSLYFAFLLCIMFNDFSLSRSLCLSFRLLRVAFSVSLIPWHHLR